MSKWIFDEKKEKVINLDLVDMIYINQETEIKHVVGGALIEIKVYFIRASFAHSDTGCNLCKYTSLDEAKEALAKLIQEISH